MDIQRQKYLFKSVVSEIRVSNICYVPKLTFGKYNYNTTILKIICVTVLRGYITFKIVNIRKGAIQKAVTE